MNHSKDSVFRLSEASQRDSHQRAVGLPGGVDCVLSKGGIQTDSSSEYRRSCQPHQELRQRENLTNQKSIRDRTWTVSVRHLSHDPHREQRREVYYQFRSEQPHLETHRYLFIKEETTLYSPIVFSNHRISSAEAKI